MRLKPEDAFQALAVDFLRRTLPPPCIVFAIPNGGKRSRSAGAIFKRTGVLAGVHDLGIIAPGRFGTLELKAGKNTLTDSQEDFGAAMTACGHLWFEVRTLEGVRDAAAAIIAPMVLRPVYL